VPPFVVPLDRFAREDLGLAGGKAANLGELLRTRLPVPPGFCLTTAAYTRAAEGADLEGVVNELVGLPASETDRLASLAAEVRRRLVAAPIPDDVANAARSALVDLEGPVAVRSSATAEDLPFASFAGQQDTYLNVLGADAVLEAVRRCWASLWTDRAVVYRASNAIDPRTVRLAVVVQQMVDAAVAGVLFTANPLTGRRQQAVVDASPGLGEAVVSGSVNPDHFVVDALSGEVVERRPVAEPCLSDAQLRELAKIGQRIEAHFNAPQDIEFAFDASGALWIVQARPITTLFPLPTSAPRDPRDLRVYFNFNVAQGVFRPFTPMGLQAFRLIFSSMAGLAGAGPREPVVGPSVLAEAAGRVFMDVTGLLRSSVGRRLMVGVLGQMEARSAALLRPLLDDPRLAPRPLVWRRLVPGVARLLRNTRLPVRALAALLNPPAARRRLDRLRSDLASAGSARPGASAAERLDLFEDLLRTWPPRVFPPAFATVLAGVGAFGLAERLLGDLASPEERDTIRRALPHNPTTLMDLELWALARQAQADAASSAAVHERSPADLADAYRTGALPPVLQAGLHAFLARYGHRAVAEIDLGLPRWADDPAPLLGTLASYLGRDPATPAPDAHFRAAADQANAMIGELALRARQHGRLRSLAVQHLLGRARALAGLREMPKFLVVLLLARARALLASVGEELARAGRLEQPEDIFFLDLPEARAAVAGADLRETVARRRAEYALELRRRHLPRLLLSDGTEPQADSPAHAGDGNILHGTPASAGQVTGVARVILDPAGAHLETGQILVAPSTDPGWTPLFLVAGGLVMEMGGAMSHGAVVARECGIPAVVGVLAATDLIHDGQHLVVDGTSGTVILAGT
jgi:pyruvate,water dikinase